NVMDLALRYFYVRIWASPAVLGMYALKGWFIGMQDSRTPMYTAILIDAVNIVFDVIFVAFMHMTVEGVALATVIAQYSGLLLISGVFVAKYRKRYTLSFKRALRLDKMKLFFKVNGDIFLRTVCIIAVTTYFTVASSSQPYPTLAVNTLVMQLFSLFSYFMDGFAYACESLCGKYYGAKNRTGLQQVIHRVILWGVGLAVLCSLLYGFAGQWIISLLTDHEDVIQASKDYRLWLVLIPLTGFLAFLYDGILVGMTQSKIMRNAIFISTALFFFSYFAFGKTSTALWTGFILYLTGRSVCMMLMSRKQIYT
ncbi:MAG: MATE family efflux transporter, partial [Bacteroidales bacterium]|nr:MATE family efflux transporter [Bacteroidales bacterium]